MTEQRNCIKKMPFSLFSDKNNIAKLVGDIMMKLFQQIVSVIVQFNPNKHAFQKQPFTNVL